MSARQSVNQVATAQTDVYGDMFVGVYVTMLRHELELFARQVTEWERQRYREVM